MFLNFKMKMREKRFKILMKSLCIAADRYVRQALESSVMGGVEQLPKRWQSTVDFEVFCKLFIFRA